MKKRRKVFHNSYYYFAKRNVGCLSFLGILVFIMMAMVAIKDFSTIKSFAQTNSRFETNDKIAYNDTIENLDSFFVAFDYNIVDTFKTEAEAKAGMTKEDSIMILRDSLSVIKSKLCNEVNKYIKKYAPKSKMSAVSIVEACLDSGYDIPLLLSQAHNESHFGTTSKKVFGVSGKHYSNPNKAIIDYIELMQEQYVKTRSVEEALRSGLRSEKYKRAFYAESYAYARKIANTRNKIKSNTDIDELTKTAKEVHRKIEDF